MDIIEDRIRVCPVDIGDNTSWEEIRGLMCKQDPEDLVCISIKENFDIIGYCDILIGYRDILTHERVDMLMLNDDMIWKEIHEIIQEVDNMSLV
jgi:hypothetical protein